MSRSPSAMLRLLPLLSLVAYATSLPLAPETIPVVIWHGLGDQFDAPGLASLKSNLEMREDLGKPFVWIVRIEESGSADSRATFFGSATAQIDRVCEQLQVLPELFDPSLNPSGHFDAIGFSQGGQLLRGAIERCGLPVRNLITLGSQHMGISSLPPCPPGAGPFSTCRLMHLSIVRWGLYSSWAQSNIIPAQYVRDTARIDDYLRVNTFLKDINNERVGDKQVGPPDVLDERDEPEEPEPRNATYKANLSSVKNFVMFRFSNDKTVVPPQSAHFTLPSPLAPPCKPTDPMCYLAPVPYSYLPLYSRDYVGLKQIDARGGLRLGVCEGEHMEIDEICWESVVTWLGKGDGRGRHRGGLMVQD